MDTSRYQGIGQFGAAYQRMYEQDVHAPGSVDRILLERMVRLCAATVEYLYTGFTALNSWYHEGDRPVLEQYVRQITDSRQPIRAQVEAITSFCAGLGDRGARGLEEMSFGGTEEEIIARGSSWCTDVARVGCALFQVSGLPSRLVFAADTGTAYSGHSLTEVWYGGRWGAVDPTYGVMLLEKNGIPISMHELVGKPERGARSHDMSRLPYQPANQFRAVALANYPLEKRHQYDYTVTGINEYYRHILEMAVQGWPGGLRWLFNEDRA